MKRLSSELQFISDILRSSLKPNHSHDKVNSFSVGDHISWDEFIPLATYHGVGGLLLYWLRKLKLESSLPSDVYRALQAIHEYNLHFSLRPMGDIDLLVKKSNQSRIIKLMLEMGFNLYETSQTCDKFFIRGISKPRREKTHKPIFVEVHSNLQVPIRLNRSFSVDMDEFWNGTQVDHAHGFPFLQLRPTYNLIYLCTHFAEHHFSRLIWAYDIALLIHRHGEEIAWGKLEDLCNRMKIRSPLYYSLSLCRELFQIPIPEKVLKSLSLSWGRRKMGELLISRSLLFPERFQVSRFNQFLIKALSIDSWVNAMLWFLFPTREWVKQHYSVEGTREIYPYYVFHPVLYLIKGIWASWRI
jgi:hypothetical protein